jgi:hypothetical protein
MNTYKVRVVVEYNYEVEAESLKEARAEGWKYEDYAPPCPLVYSIKAEEVEEEDTEEGE